MTEPNTVAAHRAPRRVMTQAEREIVQKRLDEVCLPIAGTDMFAYTDGYDDTQLAAEMNRHPIIAERGPINAWQIGYVRDERVVPMTVRRSPTRVAKTAVGGSTAATAIAELAQRVAYMELRADALAKRIERLEARANRHGEIINEVARLFSDLEAQEE